MDSSGHTPAVDGRPQQNKGPFWKNPWFIGTFLGFIFVTSIRPCTRYEPPAPSPILRLNEGSLPASLLKAFDGNTSIMLTKSDAETSNDSLRPVLERLREGLELWEQPIQLHAVGWGIDNNQPKDSWTAWRWSEKEQQSFWQQVQEHPEALPIGGARNALWIVSNNREICGFMEPTEDGGIEAFHKAVRMHLEKSERNF